jgi:pyruvate dehydrogenase E2 component (dihydrolipoamide acetyltransferase)
VTSHDEVEVTRLLEIVRRERPHAEAQGVHLTLLPFAVKAVVAGLKAEPYLSAELDMEAGEILLKKRYHIGIATDTPEGLIVPVVRDADQKSVLELTREIVSLTEKARNRTAALSEVTGSTFTITNYGAFGGSFGTPIINPPEVAILGLGRAQDKPVARDGQVVIRPMLPLSLSFDHRLIDGATAQRFLNHVMARLEDPDLLLLEL